MADLLTHVLVPFVLLTPLSWRFRWLTDRWIVLAMAGAAIPDLVKIGIVVDDGVIESLAGAPFIRFIVDLYRIDRTPSCGRPGKRLQ